MSKFHAGQIIVAKTSVYYPFDEEVITKGNLYQAGHTCGADETRIWIVGEDNVSRPFSEDDFERANIAALTRNGGPENG